MENFNIIDLVYTNKTSISRELCNDIINLFEQEDSRYAGLTSSGLNKNIKVFSSLIKYFVASSTMKLIFLCWLLSKFFKATSIKGFEKSNPIIFCMLSFLAT